MIFAKKSFKEVKMKLTNLTARLSCVHSINCS